VTADDGKGGVATDTVNIEVFRRALMFDEVRFDLNKSVLRPEARPVLDQAARTLKENPDVHVQIEGHASEEASAEYNQALGSKRAQAVREYLVKEGVEASRLDTISYGKTRPSTTTRKKRHDDESTGRPRGRGRQIAPGSLKRTQSSRAAFAFAPLQLSRILHDALYRS
jgi:outer membrane protein OmpA-like peptidoglycan-associated protein